MKLHALVFCLLLCASFVSAKNQPHLAGEAFIIAVEDDAPATDVVFAANFAAQMKADVNAGFIGTTRTDLADTFGDEFGPRVIVLLSDNTAYVYNSPGKYEDIARAVRNYLREADYTVLAFGEVPQEEPVEVVVQQEEQKTEEKQPGPVTEEPVVIEPVPEPPQPEEVPPPAEPIHKEESIVTKFWHWLSGLFG